MEMSGEQLIPASQAATWAALNDPEILKACARKVGSQAVVMALDVKKRDGEGWVVYTHGGRQDTGLDAVVWAARMAELGVTRSQWTLIAVVARRPGLTQRVIAESLEIKEASAGRLIDKLCQDGMLIRQARDDIDFLRSSAHAPVFSMVDWSSCINRPHDVQAHCHAHKCQLCHHG